MEVTLSGITIEVKEVQYEKAHSPIEVTLSGIIVEAQPKINLLVEVSIIALQLFLESYIVFPSSTLIVVKDVQPEKALFPIEVTLSGITIEHKDVQPQKAAQLILVTLSGITMSETNSPSIYNVAPLQHGFE